MASFICDEWTSRKARILYRGEAAPNPTRFYLCLTDNVALGRASTIADWVGAELPRGNGYDRRQLLWSTDGEFSNASKRHELPQVTAAWQATGGSLQFQTWFLLADAHSRASESVDASAVTAATSSLSIPGHLFSTGDRFVLKEQPGGVLPAPLVTGTVYTAIVSGGTIKPATSTGTPIALQNSGSGAFWVKYASGTATLVEVGSTPILLQDGQPAELDIDITEQTAIYGTGA